eukprot:g3180.t1
MQASEFEGQYSAADYLNAIPPPTALSKSNVKFTVVELEDVGTVGSDGSPLNRDSPYSNHYLSKERVALGLPFSFSSSKKPHSSSKRRGKSTNGESGGNRAEARIRTMIRRPLLKYWLQRYSLFSRFDEGIAIDDEGWYSTTPECIAIHHAKKCVTYDYHQNRVILDGFCGVGGNVIQFAKNGHFVIAIDIDPKRIELAKQNATVYGVQQNVDFIHGDFFQIAPALQPDVVYLSPPWGGPEYLQQNISPLSAQSGLGSHLSQALEVCSGIKQGTPGESLVVMMFLPRTVDWVSLDCLVERSGLVLREIEIMKVNGCIKGLTVISE